MGSWFVLPKMAVHQQVGAFLLRSSTNFSNYQHLATMGNITHHLLIYIETTWTLRCPHIFPSETFTTKSPCHHLNSPHPLDPVRFQGLLFWRILDSRRTAQKPYSSTPTFSALSTAWKIIWTSKTKVTKTRKLWRVYWPRCATSTAGTSSSMMLTHTL